MEYAQKLKILKNLMMVSLGLSFAFFAIKLIFFLATYSSWVDTPLRSSVIPAIISSVVVLLIKIRRWFPQIRHVHEAQNARAMLPNAHLGSILKSSASLLIAYLIVFGVDIFNMVQVLSHRPRLVTLFPASFGLATVPLSALCVAVVFIYGRTIDRHNASIPN